MHTFNLTVNIRESGKSVDTDSHDFVQREGCYARVVSDEHMGDFVVEVTNEDESGKESDSFRIDFRRKQLPYLCHWNAKNSDETFIILFTGKLSSRID